MCLMGALKKERRVFRSTCLSLYSHHHSHKIHKRVNDSKYWVYSVSMLLSLKWLRCWGWLSNYAAALWATVCLCLQSQHIFRLLPPWAGCLIPVRWCLVSNLIKLLDAIPGHNVWIMFVWQTCSLLCSCAHTACFFAVSTAGHSHFNFYLGWGGRELCWLNNSSGLMNENTSLTVGTETGRTCNCCW